MTSGRKIFADILPAATVTVLFIVILLLVMLSAMSYRSANEVLVNNNNERALRTYVAACIRENSLSEVRCKTFDGAPGIAIRAAGSDFERRIYMKDGKLLEEYAAAGAPASPEDALLIGETGKFQVTIDGGLAKIETDSGVSYARTH